MTCDGMSARIKEPPFIEGGSIFGKVIAISFTFGNDQECHLRLV
jgi:hypothetical protein